jgi:hypothetical protein
VRIRASTEADHSSKLILRRNEAHDRPAERPKVPQIENKPRYASFRAPAPPIMTAEFWRFSRGHAPFHFRLDVLAAGAELRSSETQDLAERDGRLPRLRLRGRKSQRSVARLPIAPAVESAKA